MPPRNADTNRHGRCRPPTAPASTELPSTTEEEAACLKQLCMNDRAARRAGPSQVATPRRWRRRRRDARRPRHRRRLLGFSPRRWQLSMPCVGGPSNHRSPFILNWELVQAGPHPTPRECPQTPPRPPLLARLVTRSYWMPQREWEYPNVEISPQISPENGATKLLGNCHQTKIHCKAS